MDKGINVCVHGLKIKYVLLINTKMMKRFGCLEEAKYTKINYRAKILLRKHLWIDARNKLHRILVIDFLQDFIWQTESIHAPECVIAFVVWEVFVFCFQYAEVC